MKNIFKTILFGMMYVFSAHAFAVSNGWDGEVAGKISQIQVTSGNNYGFRVVLEGSPKLCGNEHGWAYVNESDSNYNVYVSVLTAANAAKQNVKLFTTKKDGATDGYCHIGFVYILN